MKKIDYVAEDGELCEKCAFFDECPLEYICETLLRQAEYEEESENVRNGNSTEKVR